MAAPISAGMGLLRRSIRARAAQPAMKTMGAAGYHQRRTGVAERKSVAAVSARKTTAEKMMKARMRSNAPRVRMSERHGGLQQDGVGGRAVAGMKAGEGAQRAGGELGLGQRAGDARDGHGEDHESAEDAEDNAGGEDSSAGCAEERLAELRHECGVGVDLVQGDDGEESEADQHIEGGDDEDAAGEGDGQRARWVADLAGDFACFPPAAEAKKAPTAAPAMAATRGSAPGRRAASGSRLDMDGVAGSERPADQRDEHGNLEPVERGHDAAAEAGCRSS